MSPTSGEEHEAKKMSCKLSSAKAKVSPIAIDSFSPSLSKSLQLKPCFCSTLGEFVESSRRPLALQPPLVQAKLTIGQPNDKHEQEADRVAEQVMSMPEPRAQRACPSCDENEAVQISPLAAQITPLVKRQVEPEKEEEEESLQAKRAEGHAIQADTGLETQINSMKGGGQPLSSSERAFFEPRFGWDFSKVRVHDDVLASEVAQELEARAFTLGQDIMFRSGEYAPRTLAAKKLIAHELAHVVQQMHSQSSSSLGTNFSSTSPVQRKIVTPRKNWPSVHRFFRHNGFYSYSLLKRAHDISVIAHGKRPNQLVHEILWSLAHSDHEFKRTADNINREIKIRKSIVYAASIFAANMPSWGRISRGELIGKKGGIRVNSKYWDLIPVIHEEVGRYDLIISSKGKFASKAIDDIWKNPKLYAYECLTSVLLIQYKAMLDRMGPVSFNKRFNTGIELKFPYETPLGPHKALTPLISQGLKHEDISTEDNLEELIPGDMTNFKPIIQNAIYVGNGQFSVHPFGIIDRNDARLKRLRLSQERYRWSP